MESRVFDRAVGAFAGSPSSFMVFLCLWRQATGGGTSVRSPARRARVGGRRRTGRGLAVEMSHQELAQVTGLSRSTVQLALGDLQEKGWVRSVQRVRGRKPTHRLKATLSHRFQKLAFKNRPRAGLLASALGFIPVSSQRRVASKRRG